MKIALIAFDGLDPRIIYDHIDSLPNIETVINNSIHGEWQTPGHTIPSFTATLTGEQYEETNFHWDKGESNYQRHRQTGYEYLWDVTDSSMTLLNIPVLYPPENIDDVMVCGFLTPDSLTTENLARPRDVQDELLKREYIHDIHADNTFDELGPDRMKDYLNEMMHKRVEIAEWLINKYDSDLFYGVWTAPDRWFHQCHLHGLDYLPLYEMADEIVGEILDIIPGDVPILFHSDHGFAHLPEDKNKAVHLGHLNKGWYSLLTDSTPSYRDDSMSIFDVYPTVTNYLDGEVSNNVKGRVMFHTKSQDQEVADRLDDLGYL